jgi:hypothetical protein
MNELIVSNSFFLIMARSLTHSHGIIKSVIVFLPIYYIIFLIKSMVTELVNASP